MRRIPLAITLALAACGGIDESGPPNIILLLADDQGWGDVGVYGAEGYATPHLDRLAAEGVRFTSFYAPEAACSPTRAAIMTGSYPVRVGIPHVLSPRSQRGLNPEEVTVAEVLRARGYATAAIGKWHLGDHPAFLPTSQGFDSYFGIPYSNDMSPAPANNPRAGANQWYPALPLLRDTTVVEREPDQTTLTRRYTEDAVAFMTGHADQPFFLYVAYSFPHVPLWASERFAGSSAQGLYGDVIQEIDWSVGEIVATLERLGLTERTLVAFTSDNGPWLVFGNHAGSAGPFREGKATTFEGGHRVPAIFRWPGRIPADRVTDILATGMDFLPTFARLAEAPVPTDRVIDGHDLWPVLSGERDSTAYDHFLFYRGGQLQAVRRGRWKLHVPHTYPSMAGGEPGRDGQLGRETRGNIALALFDLEADPGETMDLAADHPEIVAALLRHIEAGRADIGDQLTETVGARARPPGMVTESWTAQTER